MCNVVLYMYTCGHTAKTIYKCFRCPRNWKQCYPRTYSKVFHAELNEPCDVCTGERDPNNQPRSIFDTTASPAGDEPLEPVLVWRRTFIEVVPLQSRRLQNAQPVERDARGIREMVTAIQQLAAQRARVAAEIAELEARAVRRAVEAALEEQRERSREETRTHIEELRRAVAAARGPRTRPARAALGSLSVDAASNIGAGRVFPTMVAN